MKLKTRHIEFREAIEDIINHPKVQQMNHISQHVKGISCLDHCIFVAYISFAICKKLNLDAKSAARGALLHDLYLCDWEKTNIGLIQRLTQHPKMALKNAQEFGLSPVENDIIAKHMWPITPFQIPTNRESVVVNFADKACSIAEVSGVYWRLTTKKQLRKLNIALA